MGIETVQDVLFHLPRRYEDRTRIIPIGSVRPGDQVLVEADVDLAEIKFGRRRSLLVRISDGTGALTLRFFHFNKNQQQGFTRGSRVRVFGEIRNGTSTLEIVHPEYQRLNGVECSEVDDRLTAIYPTADGIHQLTLRKLSDQALAYLGESCLPDWLPIDQMGSVMGLHDAIQYVHRPPPDADLVELEEGVHPSQKRLSFEELLAHHLSLRRVREKARQWNSQPIGADRSTLNRYVDSLAFDLTHAQEAVVNQVLTDMQCTHPMMRLVQGDVGSGKTVVAAAAAIQVVAGGAQVAVMAPTELLAQQLYDNFLSWFAPLKISVGWLSGKIKGKARTATLAELVDGRIQLIVGTHALFQDEVEYHNLSLVIIDEQHRFGVHQRLSLRDKGRNHKFAPHQLIMTATPIPRTLSMALYADLDTSVIDELPPGRTPVQTVVIPDTRREEVIDRVRNACVDGRQVYWVCTLIDESESLQCQAAEIVRTQLGEALPGVRIGLVHGRLKDQEKTECMLAFKRGEIDLLVATTVIEVGVDVPNASLMIIENPERLGLSQLHQLRGRVGRGKVKSSCVLMYHGPLSQSGKQRLRVMRETNDGFEISRKDLELRGPGEVLGTRQTGLMQFQIADLVRDQSMLPKIETIASYILKKYPERVSQIIRRWLGRAEQYGEV